MRRSPKLYVEDILDAITQIESYTKQISLEHFSQDRMRYDAVLRNLEVIGEAVKKLPPELKKEHPKIEWSKISGLRDIISHAYFGVDVQIIWDIILNKIPKLKETIKKMSHEL